MILGYSNNKKNTRTIVCFRCDGCLTEYRRMNRNYQKMKKNPLYTKDFCLKCWTKLLNNREEYKRNMSRAIQKMYLERPEIRQKISKTLKERKVNCGSKNGMKQLSARRKVSLARKKMFQDPAVRKHYSDKVKEAWARGDFEGVRVGQCSWYDYKHSNGTVYKVQGKWELAFIKWLDRSGLHFKCHRGRIPYVLCGEKKNYYPDFWVDEWDCYAEVKCKYFYSEKKFQAIERSNPNDKVRLLFKEDLLKLGVGL